MTLYRSFIRSPRKPLAMSLAVLAASLCSAALSLHAASHPRLVITPAPGFTIAWDGNNGGFNTPDAGAGPSNNVALASNGTVAFTSSDLGPQLGIPFHVAANLNDGLYGNSASWISGDGDPVPFAGLRFAASVNLSSIAWSRDNGNTVADACGGTCTDRTVGIYTLQFTQVTAPDRDTPETGDAATGWADLGTVQYLPGAEDASFTSYLRHRYDVSEGGSPIPATGIRIKVPVAGLAGGTDIDEIEVNPIPDPVPPISNFIEITPEAGFAIAWDRNDGLFSTPATPAPAPVNDASTSRSATPFTSSDLGPAIGVSFHRAVNLNDGLYGNANSWIPNFVAGDATPFAGINFGRALLLRNVAWGRDNGDVAGDCCGGTLTDRALGIYVLQVTAVANPGASTPDSDWVTVGTINYKANNPAIFNSHLRHRFDVTQGGNPITATGIRIKVPNANSAIDEIEANGNLAIEQNAIRIASAPGISIAWDGNDGQFNDPSVGAAPPANRALVTAGTTPFTSSDLGPLLGIPFHVAANLNDGLYGNANSWISANGVGGTSDPDPFAGLNFGGSVAITNIAWGRDNGNVAGDCCGGTVTDRALGDYRLQYTTVAAPDATTPDTGDASTGWADVGTVTYASAAPPLFNPHLRHRFELAEGGAPLNATGIRIKVSNGSMDIDEIEVNTAVTPPPPLGPVGIAPAEGYEIVWDGNDGMFFDAAVGAAPPSNRGLAGRGTTPFTSSDLGPLLGIPFHVAANLNDGRYGNANSWISANGIGGTSDPDPFAGLSFGGLINITNIAWSRDNGDAAEGTFTDRALGSFTLQITTVAAPDATTPDTGEPTTGWTTIGTVEYRRAEPPGFTPHLRHRFDVASGGAPIEATGVRIKVPNGSISLDEIEVNTAVRVTPNTCPTAEGQSVSVDQGGTADFVLSGADAESDPLQFGIAEAPAHGTVVIQAQTGAVIYSPAAGYTGPDSFGYTVSDGRCNSVVAVVSITVRAIDRPPTATITTGALVDFTPDFEHPVLISCNWWNACLVLDGWTSSDPEGGALTYLWFDELEPVPFDGGPVTTNCYEVGTHTIVLTVTDPSGLTGTDTKTIEVVTAPLAIELLIEKVNESRIPRRTKRELVVTLRTALRQAGDEKIRPTQNTLDAFEKKVRAQVASGYPADATAWIRWSQSISTGMEKCIKPPRKPHHDNKAGDDKKDERGDRN